MTPCATAPPCVRASDFWSSRNSRSRRTDAVDTFSSSASSRTVTVPLLAPVTTVVVVLNTINGIKAFDQIWVMTAGGPNFVTRSILEYVYDEGFTNFRVGYAAAVSMLFFVVVLAVSAVWFALVRTQERNI